jgi:hypothetical protein
MRVIRQALEVLETAQSPGTIIHSQEKWPVPQSDAIRSWQPDHPSPIIGYLTPRFREMMRQRMRQRARDPDRHPESKRQKR